jgi:hypothetical protein
MELEQIEQMEQAVLEIALEELAGAGNIDYAGLPWNAVHKAFKELGMEPKPSTVEPLWQKVVAESKRWQREALQKLWDILGISMPPWVYRRLESPNWEVFWTTYFQKKPPQVRVGFLFRDDPLVFPLPQPHPSGGFAISAWPGGMEVKLRQLYARKGQAYLATNVFTDTRAILAGLRSFAPLFTFLGLADLEGALLALEGLKDGEVRQEGAYLLAREGGTRVLFRGSLTGDPDLDGALLLGREVTLGTGEIRARMKVRVETGQIGPRMHIEEGFIEWGEEVVPFAPPSGPEVGLQERDAINRLIRDSLRHFLSATSRLIPPPSPPMRGLIEELVDSNPLEALKAEGLPSRAYMRLLSHY